MDVSKMLLDNSLESYSSIGCVHHVKVDAPKYCSLARVKRWVYQICKLALPKEQLKTGMHVPDSNLKPNENQLIFGFTEPAPITDLVLADQILIDYFESFTKQPQQKKQETPKPAEKVQKVNDDDLWSDTENGKENHGNKAYIKPDANPFAENRQNEPKFAPPIFEDNNDDDDEYSEGKMMSYFMGNEEEEEDINEDTLTDPAPDNLNETLTEEQLADIEELLTEEFSQVDLTSFTEVDDDETFDRASLSSNAFTENFDSCSTIVDDCDGYSEFEFDELAYQRRH
jgi:hypothetical protein